MEKDPKAMEEHADLVEHFETMGELHHMLRKEKRTARID